ncbi:hypothetical protein JTE90_001341 [Oedothorax gibbosus]|uniref:Autocrine motility factor receptor n=1 Tax=Oedothorax gibbosus TaxID=931172 RepID=A0AAV6V0J9_9ARAC|nr:hypothetical protein JTE90_001341 [Oedothorax gibbosus]
MEKNFTKNLFETSKKDNSFKGSSQTVPTVLITGFGPFRNFVENSSWLTVKELLNLNITDFNLVAKEIPVEYETVSQTIPKLWEEVKPKLVVHCGMTDQSDCLTLEKLARNQEYVGCDVSGKLPPKNLCCENGPEVLYTALDIDKVVADVQTDGVCVKAKSSENAGRYLCEFIFYTSLKINRNTAFVHIPPIDKPYSARMMAPTLSRIISSMLKAIILFSVGENNHQNLRMPSTLMDRLPFPSLRTYTTISVLLFSCSVYYALQVTLQPDWSMNVTENANPSDNKKQDSILSSVDASRLLLHKMLLNDSRTKKLYEMVYVMVEEPLCVFTLVNMIYCVMILVGKCIQKIVFGDLRVIEIQHIKDKFWNFVFYKFIFIFGVMNVQYMDEVILWCSWFSFVGAFHLLSTLCRDRFEYLSFSPTTPKWTHLRLFSLIFFILAVSVSLCTVVGMYASMNIFFFMAAEWTLVIIRTLYVLLRYIIHLYDITHQGIWEKRGIYTYYIELTAGLSSLAVDFLHHLHMLLWRNIFLSVASLVICMQLRVLISDIQRKISRHKNYLKVARHMEENFPLATKAEIEANADDCAICWDRMETGRKLPCGHMFHTSCLHSWMEQVTNCPTCRTSLVPKPPSDANRNNLNQDPRQATPTTNHFFHFDGSRYVSWLPSFSVEVSHTNLLGGRPPAAPTRTSQLDNMVHQVLQMFPHLPYSTVLEDLLATHSVEQTVENILEERLVVQTTMLTPRVAAFRPQRGTLFSLVFGNNRITPTHIQTHPVLVGRSPDTVEVLEPSQPNEQGESSSDSGVSDNTVRTEESTIVTGGDGCRFSKNSQEREDMLSSRKDELLRKARSKYISRILSSPLRNQDSSSSG